MTHQVKMSINLNSEEALPFSFGGQLNIPLTLVSKMNRSHKKDQAHSADKESLSVNRCKTSAEPRLAVTALFSFMLGIIATLNSRLMKYIKLVQWLLSEEEKTQNSQIRN